MSRVRQMPDKPISAMFATIAEVLEIEEKVNTGLNHFMEKV